MRKVFLLFLVGVGAFVAGRVTHGRAVATGRVVVLTDTVVTRDTVVVRVPEYVEIPSVRTVTVRDTVVLPAVTRVYEDTTFRAVVSGIDPRLDSLTIYPQVRTVTRNLRRPVSRWGLGVTAGVAVTPKGVSPSLTVGVTYVIPLR